MRDEKDKMIKENQAFKKYRKIFKGLKRGLGRSKLPNKLTEYEAPNDMTKYNKVVEDYDPSVFFEEEYNQDVLKQVRESQSSTSQVS